MSTTIYRPAPSEWRELDSREEDCGRIRVTLYWSEETGQIMIEVIDSVSGDRTFEVRPDDAAFEYQHACAR